MPEIAKILVASDVHFAGPQEKLRRNFELNSVPNPLLRLLLRFYRHYFWLKDPFGHNHLLDKVLEHAEPVQFTVANGDFSCDSAFIGLADDAAYESASICLGLFRNRFGSRFAATIGDHELGKRSLAGNCGGLRIKSWERTLELKVDPLWTQDVGSFTLVGITSSLLALPVYESEMLSHENRQWWELRAEHLSQIEKTLASLNDPTRILLFLHDPSALPFLTEQPWFAHRRRQIALALLGHLHSNLILQTSRCLAGMPVIRFCGNAVRRMSTALRSARTWKQFHLALCPSLAGLELLRDGGYLTIDLDPDPSTGPRVHRHFTRR